MPSPEQKYIYNQHKSTIININMHLMILLDLINDKLCLIMSLTDILIQAVMLQLMFIV